MKHGLDHRLLPLEIRGAVCCAIYLDHRGLERAFTEDDLAWIEGFGDHVSIAIENAMLHARATQEPGTGLATRSHFLARLRAEVRQAKADGYRVSLLLLDVEGVRLHNDLHGYAGGNLVLDHLSRMPARTAEDEALVAAFAERLAGPVQVSSRHAAAVKESETARRALADSLEACRTKYDYRQLVGQAPAMRAVFKLLDRATDTSYPVIVSGESGNGVELVARAIHINGPRKERAFISENCAAISESLLESELFGNAPGSFAGAERGKERTLRIGLRGTLVLDEVAEIPAALQAKLARVLEEGAVRPLGGKSAVKVAVRLIAGTHRDLRTLDKEGKFREDLYYVEAPRVAR